MFDTRSLRWFARAVLCALSILLTVLASGCAKVSAFFESTGLTDPPVKSAAFVQILCDATAGSTCNKESLRETLQRVLEHVADRAGSEVEVWVLGRSVAETVLVGQAKSPAATEGDLKSRRRQQKRWIEQREETLLLAAQANFSAKPPKASPIAAAMTKLAMVASGNRERRLVVITDGREYALFDFECKTLPKPEVWLKRLKNEQLLGADVLADTEVALTYVASGPIERCDVSVAREKRIRELWDVALRAAGATVSIESGPVSFANTDHEPVAKK